MEINLSKYKERSRAEKRGDACAVYLLSFMPPTTSTTPHGTLLD